MRARLALPEAPKAGLVLVQEAFGVNAHIQDVCRRLAALGYAALAPEIFHREGSAVVVDYTDVPSAMRLMGTLTHDGLLKDLEAAFAALRALPELKGKKSGVIGFCLGGYAAVLSAS